MAIKIAMPRLGWTAEAGILKEWRLADGSRVEVGDVLFAVEGDKAVEEIEALDPGILHIPRDAPVPGQSVPIGTLLAYILQEDETLSTTASVPDETASTAPQATKADHSEHSATPAQAPPDSPTRAAISPRARRLALNRGIDWQGLKGSGRTGRIVERDIVALARSQKSSSLSPVARRLALESGIEIEILQKAFPGKRVSAEMVSAFLSERQKDEEARRVVPFTPMRQAIAHRLSSGLSGSAPVTLNTEMDATELVRLRAQLKADEQDTVPSYNVLFLKVLAHALKEHAHMNAWTEENALVLVSSINIGIAVQTERGLLVPVVHNVDRKHLRDLQQEAAHLIDGAVSGSLPQSQLRDGTFTITNLGHWEVDAFTPILNFPQVAILGIGRIRPKPVVRDAEKKEIVVCQSLVLSLTFDHRAVDGAPAASFLQRVKKLAEQPYLWLTS